MPIYTKTARYKFSTSIILSSTIHSLWNLNRVTRQQISASIMGIPSVNRSTLKLSAAAVKKANFIFGIIKENDRE